MSSVRGAEAIEEGGIMTRASSLAAEITKDTMEGETEIERELNAYLTKRFVLTEDAPADECLSEARDVLVIVKKFLETGGRL